MFKFRAADISQETYLATTWRVERRRAMVTTLVVFAALAVAALAANGWSIAAMLDDSIPQGYWNIVKSSIIGEVLGFTTLVSGVTGTVVSALFLAGNLKIFAWLGREERKVFSQLAAMGGQLAPTQQMAMFYFAKGSGPVAGALTFEENAFACEKEGAEAGDALECPYDAVYKVFRRGSLYVLRAHGTRKPVDFVADLDQLEVGERKAFPAFLDAHLPAEIFRYDRPMSPQERATAMLNPDVKDVWDK